MFRLKGAYKEIIREHWFSVACFLVATFFASITMSFMPTYHSMSDKAFSCLSGIFFGITFAILPFEAYRAWKKNVSDNNSGKKGGFIAALIAVAAIGIILGIANGIFSSTTTEGLARSLESFGFTEKTVLTMANTEFVINLIFVLITYIFALYYFYKASGLPAGMYILKVMVAGLISLIWLGVSAAIYIAIGQAAAGLVAYFYQIYILIFLLYIGLVLYPFSLILLSKTKSNPSCHKAII